MLALTALLAISGQAMATTFDLGAQMAPAILNVGDTFNTPQNQFTDDFIFSIPAASVYSVTSTFSMANIFDIANLQSSLYSGTPDTGVLVEGGVVNQVSGPGFSGTIVVIDPITLQSGNYFLQVSGDVTGTSGGSYTGVMNISAVPEAKEWALLLSGLGLIGFIAARRRRNAGVGGEFPAFA